MLKETTFLHTFSPIYYHLFDPYNYRNMNLIGHNFLAIKQLLSSKTVIKVDLTKEEKTLCDYFLY